MSEPRLSPDTSGSTPPTIPLVGDARANRNQAPLRVPPVIIRAGGSYATNSLRHCLKRIERESGGAGLPGSYVHLRAPPGAVDRSRARRPTARPISTASAQLLERPQKIEAAAAGAAQTSSTGNSRTPATSVTRRRS